MKYYENFKNLYYIDRVPLNTVLNYSIKYSIYEKKPVFHECRALLDIIYKNCVTCDYVGVLSLP